MGLPGFEPGSAGPKPASLTRLADSPLLIILVGGFIKLSFSCFPEKIETLKFHLSLNCGLPRKPQPIRVEH